MDDIIMMSLGLFSNVWLRVNTYVVKVLTWILGVESLGLTKTTKLYVYWSYSYWVTWVQQEKKIEEHGKILFSFSTVHSLALMCWGVKKRSEFPNVWGNYKHHSNPYIIIQDSYYCTLWQGTIYCTLWLCAEPLVWVAIWLIDKLSQITFLLLFRYWLFVRL